MTDNTTADLETLADDFPVLVGTTADDVTHTETRLGEPVAVVDAAWQFFAQWAQFSEDTDLIVFDTDTWDELSESSKDYVVAHEAHERDLAREAGDIGTMSPTDIVDRHHDEANRRAVADIGEDAASTYAREMFEMADEHPAEQANHVLRGVGHLVPDDIETVVV